MTAAAPEAADPRRAGAEASRRTAIEAALAAGKKALELFRTPLRIERKEAFYPDFVSEADHAAEERIIEVIRARFPEDVIHAEEAGDLGAADGSGRGTHWHVDPIDGTSNFIRGLPGWCVSICRSDADGPIAAVVYDPVHDELFSCARGAGAALDGKALRPRHAEELGEGLVDSHVARDLRPGAPRKTALAEAMQLFGHRSIGSAALSMAWTAAGRLDLTYYEVPLKAWDIAAGMAICREAGLTAEFLPPAPNGLQPRVLAGPEHLVGEFKAVLESVGG